LDEVAWKIKAKCVGLRIEIMADVAEIAHRGFNRLGIERAQIAERRRDDGPWIIDGRARCWISLGKPQRALPQVSGEVFLDRLRDRIPPDAVHAGGRV